MNANVSNPQEHVPRAEHNNRTIEERIRSRCYQLPCDRLPKTLLEHLVIESPKKLNFFPARHGVSKHFSPRMIVYKENLDCSKHLEFALGECAQALDEPNIKNDNEPRTLDCLFLRPNATK